MFAQLVSCVSNIMHSIAMCVVAHGVRHTPLRQTWPVAQSVSTEQNGRGCVSGWQKPSVPQTASVPHEPPEHAGRQRPDTQCSPEPHIDDVVHSPVAGWQRPLTQWSPAGQLESPVQRLTHAWFTHERPGPHW